MLAMSECPELKGQRVGFSCVTLLLLCQNHLLECVRIGKLTFPNLLQTLGFNQLTTGGDQ